MSQVRIVTPITTPSFTDSEFFQSFAFDETTVTQVELEKGPASIEGEFEEALTIPDTLARCSRPSAKASTPSSSTAWEIRGSLRGAKPSTCRPRAVPDEHAPRCTARAPLLGHHSARQPRRPVRGHRNPLRLDGEARLVRSVESRARARDRMERTNGALLDESVKAIEEDGSARPRLRLHGDEGLRDRVDQRAQSARLRRRPGHRSGACDV